MDELTAWLRDVLDALDAGARAAFGGDSDDGVWEFTYDERVEGRGILIYGEGGHDDDQARHIARSDPRAVLARVAAEREILHWWRLATHVGAPGDADPANRAGWEAAARDYGAVLRQLAHGHRHDAPGYRPEWAPDGVTV